MSGLRTLSIVRDLVTLMRRTGKRSGVVAAGRHGIRDPGNGATANRKQSDRDHDEGSAIAGGYVYRGAEVPELVGKYLFGDIVNGRIFYVDVDDLALGRQEEILELRLLRDGEAVDLLDLVDAERADLRFGQVKTARSTS